MRNKQTEEEKLVLTYLSKIKLSASKDNRQFWSNLYQKYGDVTADRLADIVDSRADGEAGEELYKYKNENLDLSIDFSKYSADLYRRYFEWLAGRKIAAPERILDIGCDNGVVTCFYGFLYPNAKIVGIDICESGIKCAEKLAEKLNLSNVSFRVIDFKKIDQYYPADYFDLITSVRSFHEVLNGIPNLRFWSVNYPLL